MSASAQDEVVLRGVAAAPGQAVGLLLVYARPAPPAASAPIKADGVAAEQERVRTALTAAQAELEAVAADVTGRVGPDEAAIFTAQAFMAADPALGERALELVATDLQAADTAILAAAAEQ